METSAALTHERTVTVMFTLKCDVPGCNREFKHAKEIVAKRMLGYHKTATHKIRSDRSIKSYKLAAEAVVGFHCKYCHQGFTTVQLLASHVRIKHKEEREAAQAEAQRNEHIKAYKKQWRENRKRQLLTEGEQSHRQSLQKSAWWQVESSGKPEPVKLDRCPCCGARFMAVKGSE